MTHKPWPNLPSMDYSNVLAYVSVNPEPLKLKLTKALSALKYHYKLHHDYLIAEVPNYELFISELIEGEFFYPIEMEEIHILPVIPEQYIDFADYSRTKTLAFWSHLIQQKDLLDILEHRRIETLFQPIFTVAGGEVIGYEALSRGIKENGELVLPKEMIKGARQINKLYELDLICRETALRHFKEKNMKGLLFVNIIADAIFDPDYALSSTFSLINELELDPQMLVFEAIEFEDILDMNHLKVVFDAFNAKTCKTSLDNVGCSLSSIDSLSSCEPTYIRIHKKIIRSIHQNKTNQALLSRLMQLKEDYGHQLIAIGIEKKEELDYIKQFPIDLIQGFYLERPHP